MKAGKMKLLFALSSLVFLAVLAVSPTKSYFSQWRHYQKDYNQLLAQLPMRVKPVEVKIRQTWIPELGVVDRCASCHLGVDRPELAAAPQPFRTHPKLHHDPEEFGCTICHGGQGRGTTVDGAHGREASWDEPLLPRPYLEAACGRCHAGVEVSEAPKLTRGRHLVQELNCSGCHKLGDAYRPRKRSLDGIGAKTTRAWLATWLRDPRSFRPHTRMPDFRLGRDEAEVLAEFLATFRTPPAGLEPLPAALSGTDPDEDLVKLGETRFREARCISCHAVEGKGGTLAPDLAKVASKVNPQWLYTFLGDPQRLAPGIEMPRYGFSAAERIAVVAYMLSEFVDWDAEGEAQAAPAAAAPNAFEDGLRLFNHYNCRGCHELAGVARSDEMGPDLTDVGNRRVYQVEFGNAAIERTMPAYLRAKLSDPRQFLANARMPYFDLPDSDAEAVVTALLAQRRDFLPEVWAPLPTTSGYTPQGRFGAVLDRYHCLSCHTLQGQGFRLATDLTREGSRVQESWLRHYFRVPYSLRPLMTERMPNLFLPDADIDTIVEYMKLVSVDDEIDAVPLPDPGLAALGRQLLEARFSCLACHQIGGAGGYVGPPLDGVGSRLQPGWIYKWLQDPQRYRPDTIEPNEGLSERDLEALTAYLSSLRQP